MELDIFKYKDIPLYVVDLPYGFNRVHREYFTRIPWGHYKRIRYAEKVQSLSSYALKIKIFRDYTVCDLPRSDEQIEILPAGIVDTVSNLIMYVSDSGIIPDENGNINIPGFNARINLYRGLAQTNVEYQMYTVICLVFKAYTFEMLDKLSFDRISSLFASAEKYLLENGVIKTPLQIYDPRTAENPATKVKKPKETVKPKATTEENNDSVLEQFIKLRDKKEKEAATSVAEPKTRLEPPERIVAPPKQVTRPVSDNSSSVEYIPPKDAYALSNGINVAVPGIKIDKNNNLGGFSENDFKGPFLSEEEVLNLQIEMGLWPAGHEFWLKRQQAAQKEEDEEKKKTNIRIKKGIKRK